MYQRDVIPLCSPTKPPMKPIESLSDDEWQALVQRAITMPDAPPHLVQRALDLWPTQRPPPLLKRLVAVLLFDSWAIAPLASGMRALPAEIRQLVFSTGSADIDLHIAPLPEGYALSGQLLGATSAGSVELSSSGPAATRRSAAFDAGGEFRIDGLSSGCYTVTVHVGNESIELLPIEIGSPRDSGGP